MLPAGVAAGAGFHRHNNNAVDDGFGLLRGTYSIAIVILADRIAPIGNHNHHLAAFAAIKGLRAEAESVVQSGSSTIVNPVDPSINGLNIGGKRYDFVN